MEQPTKDIVYRLKNSGESTTWYKVTTTCRKGMQNMPSRISRWTLSLAIIMAAGGIHAGMYKYTDGNGGVHYTDKPPVNVTSHSVDTKINTYLSSFSSKKERAGPPSSSVHQTVTIYTASWCGVCTKAIHLHATQWNSVHRVRHRKKFKGSPRFRAHERKGSAYYPGRRHAHEWIQPR